MALTGFFAWETHRELRPFPEGLRPNGLSSHKAQFLDRNGIPLSVTYTHPWNINDWLPLHEIPPLLQNAFIESEDRRFFDHHGVDWIARAHAMAQNFLALRPVRGASTITEQVVRILHPRPRTLWSRWIEGYEAGQLEKHFSKSDILEFYLNQVPYARQRRGILQASRLYFDRDLDTLNAREALALAVLVRAPSRLDLPNDSKRLEKSIQKLARHMRREGKLSDDQYVCALKSPWVLSESRLPVDAGHFIQHVFRLGFIQRHHSVGSASANPVGGLHLQEPYSSYSARIMTTLDSSLQIKVQNILDQRLQDLRGKDVRDGAVLVVNHETGEVLAWVNGGGFSRDTPGGWIDAVTTPRQPGSTLKPFLYAMALDLGWTAATLIEDSPVIEAVGSGLHPFRNYSRKFYGPLRLREALGNSLNIPAIRTIQFTGVDRFLERLHELGFRSLTQPSAYYGEGLALGNGEVSLLELVQAYSVLALNGEFRPLRFTLGEAPGKGASRRIFSDEASSLIANILSDPQARRLEFGSGNILRLPVQTAVKTGTSNDHRDAWAVGFSYRHTVGVWMGNLDRRPTNGITGTTGPGLVLRAVFAELNRLEESRPLYLSPHLTVVNICRESGLRATPLCPTIREWFKRDDIPQSFCPLHSGFQSIKKVDITPQEEHFTNLHLLQPTPDLQLAMDPYIPDEIEAFSLTIPNHVQIVKVEWIIDGKVWGVTGINEHRFVWPVSRGVHFAQARVWRSEAVEPSMTPKVRFFVK
ncbi:hypothetical protein DAMNIGENAA_31490 [Desulforhabdus amnigena]|uniref:peptidoglycan glycosyltransferase n=1 Tax=Desulforhabdus amnigena TaxID=40218 RepID=A0A9W6LAB7_9BACT|nr:hypothetical protein DAMNIGENAA_31490 [Desulforhabdus amnigena]